MQPPADIELPFFAYGLFRPGQLGFFQLADLVVDVSAPTTIEGALVVRDGLPLLDPDGGRGVSGSVLLFDSATYRPAYERISAMEPDSQYRWGVAQVGGENVNVLLGKQARRGSTDTDDGDWDGWQDPLLTTALEVVDETHSAEDGFDWDLKPLFRLQMAYLLLWSSIERYVSLRYHMGHDVTSKVRRLADEPAFRIALRSCVSDRREIFSAAKPRDKYLLDPSEPSKAVNYYYQVRSNITHRGKAAVRDFDTVRDSLRELLAIFREVLEVAHSDAVTERAKWASQDIDQAGG